VQWLIILGEWSNMIGYEMGASPTGVYMDVHMATRFARGVFSEGQVSRATSNPPTRNLASGGLEFFY
jgi:hypothetical protein